jgi:MFS family permease
MSESHRSVFTIPNIRWFLLFRLLFNARFYYPVFTVIFLDYGLTLAQFTILNAVWAVTIVLAEVPSGAMADIFGRRNLMVLAGILMVLEMGIIALAPVGQGALVFFLFLINRVCSGLAEASASGADEALAYDTLKDSGQEDEWPKVLERLGRMMAVGLFLAMIIGAFVYDPQWVGAALNFLGLDVSLTRNDVIRLPILLTLLSSFGVLYCAWRMREAKSFQKTPFSFEQLRHSFVRVFDAGGWILEHRFVLSVILAGMILDSVARQFVTLGSEYFRFIGIPIGFFGPIWAGMGLLGWLYAKWARMAVEHLSPLFNLYLLAVILLTALAGASAVIPIYGLAFVVPVDAMMLFVGFLQSHYVNREVDSARRATVLSFQGLALNIGYGLTSIYHSVVILGIKRGLPPEAAADSGYVLSVSLLWLPFLLIVLLGALLWLGRCCLKNSEVIHRAG